MCKFFVRICQDVIHVDVLGVTLASDFINCLRPKVLFFVSDEILFAPFMFLFYSPNVEPFWYKFIFRSQRRIRTAATSKMERFVIIVNGFQSLTIITKRSVLDVAAALDPPLVSLEYTILRLIYLASLTLSWRRPLSYRNQSIDLLHKLMDWFLYYNCLRHERIKLSDSIWQYNLILLWWLIILLFDFPSLTIFTKSSILNLSLGCGCSSIQALPSRQLHVQCLQ